jgi:hypothetical protein
MCATVFDAMYTYDVGDLEARPACLFCHGSA